MTKFPRVMTAPATRRRVIIFRLRVFQEVLEELLGKYGQVA